MLGTKKKERVVRIKNELLANFEKNEPLIRREVDCTICFSILVDPVTFPCKHSICLHCFDKFIRETSLNCPLCRMRLSVWSRKALKEKNTVNMKFKEKLEAQFPHDTANRRRELESMNSMSTSSSQSMFEDILGSASGYESNDDDHFVRNITFAEPGETARDYAHIYGGQQKELDRERFAEEEASQAFISQLVKDDPVMQSQMSQIEEDHKLAKELYESEMSASQSQVPVLRSQVSRERASLAKLTTPKSRKSLSAIKSNSSKTSVAARALSKSTQRRPSAPAKRKSPGISGFSVNCSTPQGSGGNAKQTKIANYFSKSPKIISTNQSAQLPASPAASTSQGHNFLSSIKSPSTNVRSSTIVKSPSSIFAHLSISNQASTLPEIEVLSDDFKELDYKSENLENIVEGSSNYIGTRAGFFMDTDVDTNDNLVTIPDDNREEKVSDSDLLALLLPSSELSPLKSERGTTEDSQISLNMGSISSKYKEEEALLQEFRQRIYQEEQDRRLARKLQDVYNSGSEPRGVFSTTDADKYSLRKFSRPKAAARQS